MGRELISTAQLRQMIRAELRAMAGGARRGALQAYKVEGGRPYIEASGFGDEVLAGQMVEPFGWSSRPSTGVGVVALRSGGQHIAIGVEDRTHRPSPAEGEVILYNAKGQKIELGASAVKVNDGARQVARNGDSCSHSLTVTIGATSYPVSGTVSIAGGTSEVLVP